MVRKVKSHQTQEDLEKANINVVDKNGNDGADDLAKRCMLEQQPDAVIKAHYLRKKWAR